MKAYKTDQIRNIALVSHNGAGKTMLVERLLYNTKVTTRLGSVQEGTAAMDFEEEEIARNSSISAALAPIEFDGKKLNFIDTPGYLDFIGEVNSSLKVTDSAVVLVEAVGGVEVGTEVVWQAAKTANKPRLILVSKMDRDNVRIRRVNESINNKIDGRVVHLQIPIGEGPGFKGVIDLVNEEVWLGESDKPEAIPADMAGEVEDARLELIEAAAEGDDALMEKYFEDDTLSKEDIIIGLRKAMAKGEVAPVLYCAAEPGIAVKPFLHAVAALMPAPNDVEITATNAAGEEEVLTGDDSGPLAAFIFKTREDTYGKTSYLRLFSGMLSSDSRVWDSTLDSEVRIGTLQIVRGKEQEATSVLHAGDIGAVVKLGDSSTNHTLCDRGHQLTIPPIEQPNPIASVAIHPVSQSDVAKLSSALQRLAEEDKTLNFYSEQATHETILSGMGMTHLQIAVKKAQSKFGVNIRTTIPKVPYRETITKTNSAEYTHKKQTGGAGQYGRVYLRLESLGDDEEFEFDSEIFGGAISAPFVAATEKGCRQALEKGPLAGFQVVGVRAIVYDGKEHPVDSKEIAFQTAGRECFKKAMLGAGPVMLEPIYEVTVTVPADNMGDIMGDLNTRRGRIIGTGQEGTKSVIKAEVPFGEMQTYAADLRSMTQGRGVFSMKYLNYGRVPAHLQGEIIAKVRLQEEEEG